MIHPSQREAITKAIADILERDFAFPPETARVIAVGATPGVEDVFEAVKSPRESDPLDDAGLVRLTIACEKLVVEDPTLATDIDAALIELRASRKNLALAVTALDNCAEDYWNGRVKLVGQERASAEADYEPAGRAARGRSAANVSQQIRNAQPRNPLG